MSGSAWRSRPILAFAALAVVASQLRAQPTEAVEDTLPRFSLEQLVVTANRRSLESLDTPRQVAVLSARFLEEGAFSATPDVLKEMPGILVQKTNLGGGSPFIRGMTGKQVVILVDGIRLNNATYRYGPNQYLNTIDPLALRRVELVYGPGSVLYGSDALGGVVNLRTEAALQGSAGARLGIHQRFSSADRGLVSRVDFRGGSDRTALAIGGTLRKFGDLRAGAGASPVGAEDVDGRQPFTGYGEGALNASVRHRLAHGLVARAGWLTLRQKDVPKSNRLIRSTRVPNPDEENAFDPQQLSLGFASLEWSEIGPLERLVARVSMNLQEEGRRERRSESDVTRYERDDVRALGSGLEGAFRRLGAHRLVSGIEWYGDRVRSWARATTAGGDPVSDRGRFPDGATVHTAGWFLQDEWTLLAPLTVTLGGRASWVRIAADFGDATVPSRGRIGEIVETYSDLTWSAAALWRVGSSLRFFGTLCRGFRAPNLDDLAVDGNWDSGRDVPNPDVEPETVIQVESGLKLDDGVRRFSLSLYHNRYHDLIQRTLLGPGPDGLGGTLDDLFHFDNVARAVIRGMEAYGAWSVLRGPWGVLSVDAHASAVYGQNLTDDAPLRRIPPRMGQAGIRWESTRFMAEGYIRAAGRQTRLSGGDLRDERIPVGGSPAWATFNLRGGVRMGSSARLGLAVENLLDRRYRLHGSGIDEPGFNVIASLAASF